MAPKRGRWHRNNGHRNIEPPLIIVRKRPAASEGELWPLSQVLAVSTGHLHDVLEEEPGKDGFGTPPTPFTQAQTSHQTYTPPTPFSDQSLPFSDQSSQDVKDADEASVY